MKTAFYAIMILVTISSCQRKEKCNCNSLAWVEKYNDSLLNRKHYPEHHVKRFGEEDLRIMGNHTIRFVISRAFGDSKLYRIEQKENSYSLLTKTFVCGEFSD